MPAMALKDPSFTIGIEEEYLLVDQASRDLVREMPHALFEDCEQALRGQVAREFLKSQIEVETQVHKTPRAAGEELKAARATVARLAAEHGLAPIAASTHPFARWSTQQPTERERYQAIAKDLAGVGRRLVICGMHVHVGIEDDELRIDLMNQARYFLPHLLVLSTSSPFAEGEDTGLKCYRLAAYQELPRTGLPGKFESWEEYRSTVDVLVRNGVIEDASKIWWDLRPSAKFPTLEMRVTDVCTGSRTPCAWRRCTPASCACSTASAAPTRPGAAIRCSCSRRTAGGRSAMASTARCSISAAASWCPSAISSTSCW